MTPPQAAPGTALQISLDARFAATWFCLLPGHNVLARQTVTATRQLVVWWPRRSEDTGAGRLISSLLVLTPTIRTHCLRGWDGAGGLISSLAVLKPTIRTHCVRQWGQRPELLGHNVLVQENRKMALLPGHNVLARQTVTATRQLVCLVATTVGRHRCWGAHSISFGFDTHHPDPLLQAMGSTP